MFNRKKMIRPDRHTNIDLSVVNISSVILGYLNKFYDISYDSLLTKVIDKIGEGARENYPYALNFLYLLGKISYIEETDSFIYNETK